MSTARDSAALVALMRLGGPPAPDVAERVESAGSARPVLERELAGDGNQGTLLPVDPDPLIERAGADIAAWRARGMHLVTVLDASYPTNLRRVHDRPPLLFVAGRLQRTDERSVAVIGSRRASAPALEVAARLAEHLVGEGYTVVSGLAAGIDTAAHRGALGAAGRTIAVIGTGLGRFYPSENRELQERIARECAVVSQFWPDDPPSQESFPRRNAVMSGLARGTVIVEASVRSGARVQARLALTHGRPVFLAPGLLEQPWARELAKRPGVHVIREAGEITAALERLDATDALVE
jgi:DNA processing protein